MRLCKLLLLQRYMCSLFLRVLLTGMKVVRPKLQVGRYKMIRHTLDQGNAINQNR